MVQTKYGAKVIFEASIDTNGNNYLVIYGKHINGYFCCIPNWKVGCEMAEPSDTCYNFNKLVEAGIQEAAAKEIAKDISENGGCDCKGYKVRVEDMENGRVDEFESNCLCLVSLEETQEDGKFDTTTFSCGNCTSKALFAMAEALERETAKTNARFFNALIADSFSIKKKERNE